MSETLSKFFNLSLNLSRSVIYLYPKIQLRARARAQIIVRSQIVFLAFPQTREGEIGARKTNVRTAASSSLRVCTNDVWRFLGHYDITACVDDDFNSHIIRIPSRSSRAIVTRKTRFSAACRRDFRVRVFVNRSHDLPVNNRDTIFGFVESARARQPRNDRASRLEFRGSEKRIEIRCNADFDTIDGATSAQRDCKCARNSDAVACHSALVPGGDGRTGEIAGRKPDPVRETRRLEGGQSEHAKRRMQLLGRYPDGGRRQGDAG